MKRKFWSSVAMGGVLGAVASGSAFGQTPAAPADGEERVRRDVIVVTAQKREEDVQDVPISISAFSAETLEEAGVKDIRDLKFITPGLSFATAPQTTNTRVSIRGIGTSGNTAIEPSVAVFVDGVYVPRVGSLLAGLNDVGAVEVLRGPQGTLFGRNASMGAINIRTSDPGKSFGGQAGVLMGSFGRVKGDLAVDVPLSDTFRTRLAVMMDTRDGYGTNVLTGKDISYSETQSVRLGAEWDIAPNLTWTVKGDFQRMTGDGIPISTVVKESVTPAAEANWRRALDPDGTTGPLIGDVPILTNTYTLTVRQESEGNLNDKQYGVSSELTWDLGNDYTVKLISGYRDWKNAQYQQSTGGFPLGLTPRDGRYASESYSNELQIISPDVLGGKLNYVAGLYQYEKTSRSAIRASSMRPIARFLSKTPAPLLSLRPVAPAPRRRRPTRTLIRTPRRSRLSGRAPTRSLIPGMSQPAPATPRMKRPDCSTRGPSTPRMRPRQKTRFSTSRRIAPPIVSARPISRLMT